MTPSDHDKCWDQYSRDENDFPSPGRGYHEEELPIASDDADNECGGVLGADGHIYSDADPGL